MNNEERKRLVAFVFPYVFVIIGMFALIILVIVYAPVMEHTFTALSILILAVGVFLSWGLAMLAGDIFRLGLYLEKQLENKEVD